MAGFTSHYRFGVHTFHKMDHGELRDIIRHYHNVFTLGEQGPDLFFFEPTSYIRRKGNPASFAHDMDSGLFVMSLIKHASSISDPTDRKIAIAYSAGFLGHYELDTAIHPYVYGRVDPDGTFTLKTLGHHFLLENDIDSAVYEHATGRPLSSFRMHSVIRLTLHEIRVITSLLYKAYSEIYPSAHAGLFLMYRAVICELLAAFLLSDSTGIKKRLVLRAEKLILGFPFATGIICSKDPAPSMDDPFNLKKSPWINPATPDHPHNESVPDLFKGARSRYLKDLSLLERYITCTDSSESSQIFNRLCSAVGNRSMHTGL